MHRIFVLICAGLIFFAGLSVGFCVGARWASHVYSTLYSPTAEEANP